MTGHLHVSTERDTIRSRVAYFEYLLQLLNTRRSRERSLTLKKSSWCTTQQLGNVFISLSVNVVFPPLVTLKRKKTCSATEVKVEKRRITVSRLQEPYPPMPMMIFILLVCVGHLWNSVNKRREPRQKKNPTKNQNPGR